MFEDGVEHRAGALHEPLDVLCALAVDVREEEKLLVALDHETREVHGTEVVLHVARNRASTGGSSSVSALASAGALIGKSITR